jgi:hypothetical protein
MLDTPAAAFGPGRGRRPRCSSTSRRASGWSAMCARSSPAAGATPSCRRRPQRPDRPGWPAPGCSPMCSPPSTATTCRCTAKAPSTRARVCELERSTLADWVAGSRIAAASAGAGAVALRALGRPSCTPTTRPCRCLLRARAHAHRAAVGVCARRPAGGRHGCHLPCGSPTRPTAGVRTRSSTCATSAASCRRTPSPASMPLYAGGRMQEAGCWAHVRRKFFDLHARTTHPSPKRRWCASACCMPSKPRCAANHRRSRPRSTPDARRPRCSMSCTTGSTTQSQRVPRKSGIGRGDPVRAQPLAALVRYAGDGRIEIDNNAAERALRGSPWAQELSVRRLRRGR